MVEVGLSSCRECGTPLPAGGVVCSSCSLTQTPDARQNSIATAVRSSPELPSIDGFRILEPIGEGGMGAIFLAEELTLRRRVALKLVSDKIAGDAGALARFLREARALATVEHPNIVRVYAFGETGERAYIAMELVEGETLGQRIRRKGRLEVAEALAVVRDVARALAAAWEKRIVHRDVKPSNILFDRWGHVKVADFGLAKEIRDDGPPGESITRTGYFIGSPHYLSPQQATGEDVDFRTDIYSLGIVLYEMLTGARPFEGSSPVAVVAKHLHEIPPSLKVAGVPDAVAALFARMTAKNPDERPQSYEALLKDLDQLLEQPPTKQRIIRQAGFLAAIAAIAIFAVWMAVHTRHGESPPAARGSVVGSLPAQKALPSEPVKAARKTYTGEKLELRFKDFDIVDLPAYMLKRTGVSFAVDPNVTGTMTYEISGVAWDEALDSLLESFGVEMTRRGNLVRLSIQGTQAGEIAEQNRVRAAGIVDISAASPGGSYKGAPITIEIRNGTLQPLLREVVRQTQWNIIINPLVGEKTTTLAAKDVPWDQLFELVLRQNHLVALREGSFVKILTVEQAIARAKR